MLQYSPFTKITSYGNGSEVYDGYCTELLDVMAQKRRFKYVQFLNVHMDYQDTEICHSFVSSNLLVLGFAAKKRVAIY